MGVRFRQRHAPDEAAYAEGKKIEFGGGEVSVDADKAQFVRVTGRKWED